MKLNTVLVLTLTALPAVFGCRDRAEKNLKGYGTTTGRSSEPVAMNPSLTPPDRADKADKADRTGTGMEPEKTLPEDKYTDTNKPGDKLTDKSALTKKEFAVARINSNGALSFTGTAKIHDAVKSSGLVTINLKSSTPGDYVVKVFDTSDCRAVPMVDVASNKISLGDEANAKTPDILADLGELTVGKDGTGYVDASLTNVKASIDGIPSFDNKAVAFFAKKAEPGSTRVSGTTTAKSAVACGILSTATADMTQG
jgi:hypothetical protein